MKTEDIKNIARAWQQVQEKLKGGQKKLDMDKDGDIDAKDFAHMRAKKKTNEDEIVMNPKKDKKEKKDANSEVSQDMSNEAKVDEGSIKGSGTDRKAQLKKAYRSGEQKTRDFYKGTITPAPKTKDKGIKKAFAKGTGSNDGSPAARGIDRTTARDRLRNTEHGRSEPGPYGKTHYKTQTHASKMRAIKYAKKGKLPEATDYLWEGINIGKLHDLHAYHEKKAEAHAAAQKKHDSNSKMADHHSEQGYEHENAAGHLHNASKAYDKGDHKAVAKHLDMYHKTPVARQGIKEAADISDLVKQAKHPEDRKFFHTDLRGKKGAERTAMGRDPKSKSFLSKHARAGMTKIGKHGAANVGGHLGYKPNAASSLAKTKMIAKKIKGKLPESFDLSDFTLDDLVEFMVSEEFAQLDEISKKTLGSYINKAHKDYDKQRTKQGAAYDKAARTGSDDDEDKGHEYGRKADKRTQGIKTAVSKLTKEENTNWPIYKRLMEKDAHTKGATPPEEMDSKASGKEKEFRAKHKTDTVDNPEASGGDIAKATNAAPSKKARPGDNPQSDKMQKPVDTTK